MMLNEINDLQPKWAARVLPETTLTRAYAYALRLMDETPEGLWIDVRDYWRLAATVFGIDHGSEEMDTFVLYAEGRLEAELEGAA